ncbi:MAG: ATP-grasp ribosomal peptide maturase [Dactylosporangium sp.]|nr:ATP-grasp ribosomal peptide maturase [Dactylosporangium sp.]NNJ61758.1 ATP-grasp ribosomal peptide maturase [Dactylosporangium sp.]
MGRPSTILVLTHPFDPTADYVVAELNQRGVPVFRCDPGEFPRRLTLTARLDAAGWQGRLRLPERCVDLADIGCVYYRRPTLFDLPDDLSGEVRRWASQEARMGLGGVLATLPNWLNHPKDIAAAEYKPAQLAVATEVGLHVPPTLITNDPDAARAFAEQSGPVVYQSLTPASVADGDTHRLVFAAPVSPEWIDASVGLTAHLFQRSLADESHEVRLTAVDDTLLATRIDAHSQAARTDWRADYDHLGYTALADADIPAPVRSGITALLNRFRLRFGVFDFVVTPDETWWFLEINPNGQWAWIQGATGQPIAAAIADALQRGGPGQERASPS